MTIEHLNILIRHRDLLVTEYDKLDSYINEIEKVDEFRIVYKNRGRDVSICGEESVPHSEIVNEPFFREMKDVYLKNLKVLHSELESKIKHICSIIKTAEEALGEIEILEETA
jgi:chaperonin cofactor prefoldin